MRLWFKGLAEPVRARAEIADGSLQLKADLPFLELDSIVGVATAEGGARLHGHIRDVAFARGDDRRIPQLCIDVALTDASSAAAFEPPSAARPRRFAAIDGAASALRGGAASMAGPVASPVAGPAAHARGRRILGWLAALVVGAACGAGVALVWLAPRLQTLDGGRDDAAASSRRSRDDARERAAVAPVLPAAEAAPARESAAAAPAQAFPFSPAIVTDDGPAAPLPAVSLERYELLAPRSAGDDDAALAAAERAWSAAVARAQAAAAATQLPQVTVHGAQTHVFVPMAGDGEGLRQYELNTPGIAVTVPRARALIPIVNYNVERGIVRRVWLRREGAGVQVRVITRRTATRAAATYDETGLSIVLEP